MEFWLQQNSDKFQLPVKPSDYTVSVSHKNTVVNVIQVGDVNLIGNTGLREISLKSFFPAKDYNFSNNAGRKQPLTYVEKIESWRKSGTPIRVIITGTLNMEATVESFVCSIQIPDQSGKGRPNIVGKARHKLAVGFFCLPYNRKSAFIGHNDLIDFIGKRGYQFICCRQNTPIAISIFYINQSIGHFCYLLFYASNENDGC